MSHISIDISCEKKKRKEYEVTSPESLYIYELPARRVPDIGAMHPLSPLTNVDEVEMSMEFCVQESGIGDTASMLRPPCEPNVPIKH